MGCFFLFQCRMIFNRQRMANPFVRDTYEFSTSLTNNYVHLTIIYNQYEMNVLQLSSTPDTPPLARTDRFF